MLEGDLGDFTLPDILKLLAFTSKTGRLGIVSDGASGRVDLVQGQLRDASADADHLPLARRLLGRQLLDGATLESLLSDVEMLPTDLQLARELVARDPASSDRIAEVLHEQAQDAVFDLLRWTRGTFRFEIDATPDAGTSETEPVLAMTVEQALAEAERRLEAWSGIRERTGAGDAVVHVGRPTQTEIQIDADGWQLLGLADGNRTVDELSALCGRGEFDTRRSLAALIDLGIVTVGESSATAGVDGLLADQALLASFERSLGPTLVPQPGITTSTTPAPIAQEPDVEKSDTQQPAAQQPASQQPDPAESQPAATPAPAAAEVRELTPGAEPDKRSGELVTAAPGGRRNGRGGRLQQDPSVDADLVSRLIDGVEGL